MANVAPPGLTQILDLNGVPAAGYLLYTFDAGTSTPRPTWSDAGETTPNAHPIVLDAEGRAQVFWRGNYRIELRTPLGAVVWTQDNFNVPDLAAANAALQFQEDGANIGAAGDFNTIDFDAGLAQLIAAGSTLVIVIGGPGTVTFGGAVIDGAAGLQVTGGPFASRGLEDNYAGGSQPWELDADGALRNVGGTQPTAMAHRGTSAQTSGTTCIWNAEDRDIGSDFDPSTGVFTAPSTGYYLFGFVGIVGNTSGGSVDRGLFATTAGGSGNQLIAGGQDNRSIANGAVSYIQSVGMAYLEAGDILRVDASAAFTASVTLNTTAGNGFWVRQLG